MQIIFESVLMLFTKKYQNYTPCLSTLQLVKVGAFLSVLYF